MRWTALATVVLVASTGLPTRPVQAAPAPGAGCTRPSIVYRDATPWPQRLFAAERIWPLTTGTGVTVAVVGTGVDGDNAQFGRGQVAATRDLTGLGGPADCDGRGTFAAGIIGAHADGGTTFAGLAPGVRILPVRYTQATNRGGDNTNPDQLAAGIRAAVDAGAGVICVVIPTTVDSAALQGAVAQAQAADAVIVSPAVAAGQDGGVSYPTADGRVLAVGAVDQNGSPVSTESGDHLDVAAPGKGLVSLAAGAQGRLGHIGPVDDAGYAAAYAAATAALVRAYRPRLSASEVVARVERTAEDGSDDPRLGLGVVNPYAAVTAEGIEGRRTDANSAQDLIEPAGPAPRSARETAAIAVAVAGLLLAAILAMGVVAVKRGRARGWRPARR